MTQSKIRNHVALFGALLWCTQTCEATGSATLSYIDNVGFGATGREQISDLALSVKLNDQISIPLGMQDNLRLIGSLDLKTYEDYIYDRAWVSAGVNYQRKLGIGFYKPRIELDWTASREIYQYSEDNNLTSTLSLSWTKPVSERLDARIELSNRWQIPDQAVSNDNAPVAIRDLNSNTLDTETTSVKVSGEYFINENWSLPLALEFIKGDLVSVSSANPELARDSGAISWVPRIASNWYRYRFDGEAATGSFNLNRTLNSETTLNFGYQIVKGRSNEGIKYDQSVISVTMTKNW